MNKRLKLFFGSMLIKWTISSRLWALLFFFTPSFRRSTASSGNEGTLTELKAHKAEIKECFYKKWRIWRSDAPSDLRGFLLVLLVRNLISATKRLRITTQFEVSKIYLFDISLSFFFLYFVFFAISWTPAAVKIMSFYENLVCKRNTRKLLRATEVGIFWYQVLKNESKNCGRLDLRFILSFLKITKCLSGCI